MLPPHTPPTPAFSSLIALTATAWRLKGHRATNLFVVIQKSQFEQKGPFHSRFFI